MGGILMTAKDDYYLQGVMWHRVMTHQANRLARKMFLRATELDDTFARAHAYLSYARLIGYLNDWKETGNSDDDDVTLPRAVSRANRGSMELSGSECLRQTYRRWLDCLYNRP
jgi:hypothetical protein